MTDSPSSQRSRRSFTPDRFSPSPAASTRSSRSQRLVSTSLQRPLSIASSEGNLYGDDLLRPPSLQHAQSRFSLNELFATSRREYEFESDDYSFSESASLSHAGQGAAASEDDSEDVALDGYRDFYNLLGLARETNPTTAQIATAYEWHKASFALNEGQQPPQLKASAEKYSAKLRYAYETLIHPQRRVIYDLVGEFGLRREYNAGGIMGKGGEAELGFADTEAMSSEEFKRWFKNILDEKELDTRELLGNRGTWIVEPHSGSDLFGFVSAKDSNSTLSRLQPLQLAVYQRFGIPLERLRRLFSSHQVEKEHASDHSINVCRHGSLVGPVLIISGGITSSICSKTHQARSIFDRYYTAQFMPSCAVKLHQTFPAASNGNLLSSLLENASADINASLWPQQQCSIGLGKPLAILDKTRPFYCYLQTTFQSSSFAKPPAVEVVAERAINDNALFFYQFKSANLCPTWLGVNLQFGSYFGLPFFCTEPTADIGYRWARSRLNLKHRRRPDQRPDLIMRDEFGPEGQGGQLACTATTVSACLSAKYAFRISRDDIVSSTLPEERRGIKIEMAAYLQDNLAFTGILRALRTVGGSTQFGVGIAIRPGMGLFLTCSWSRWGQDLNIPVFLVPHDLLDNHWAWVALAIPCAIGVLVEFGLLKPGRGRKRRAIAKKKRKLSNGEKVTDDSE